MPSSPAAPTRDVVLARHRPGPGTLPSSCVHLQDRPWSPLRPGQVRVRNEFLQVTAVMADLMSEEPGLPMPAYALHEALWGGAVGTVTESAADLPVGTVVQHMKGWQEECVDEAPVFYPIPLQYLPGREYVLNQGVTAYHGMVDVAGVGAGDVVFVSGAAGGVGSLAGQIAKARGASTVIGSTGSAEKVRYLVDDLGFDAAINYRDGRIAEELAELAPQGIDVFFDTVGGVQFEAAVHAAAPDARFALCGALAGQVGGGTESAPRLDIMTAIVKQLVIRPFSTLHTPEQLAAWGSHYGQWLAEGRIVFPHTIVDGGLAVAPDVLDGLLEGRYRGNVLVRLHD
ncbi:NADP-dependent oxidoreductase [Arthrobacter sp. B1805]|uniref:MDR family NADP-dependent oxidoreductase n=1 Tax=Arthrobacter sp. B1805 TaxID=2058892 RepID=UPI000CE2E204|nr:NADP-dependent oxidoreductase [Arthrobacter sp. B1805]